jgi:hypothetical protein
MNTIMNDQHITTLTQLRSFLDGTQAIGFSLRTQSECYDFIRRMLIRFAYHTLSKPDKGLLLTFLAHGGFPAILSVNKPNFTGVFVPCSS